MRKTCSSCNAFVFPVQKWKTIAIRLPIIALKQIPRTRSPGCYINRNKIKFEPYSDLVNQAFSQFNGNSINNQDPHSLIKNDETPRAECHNENDSENTETNKNTIPNFMPQVLTDEKIAKGIMFLNSK